MRSLRHAKHVKPALHPTRSTLSSGLTAALLPLCLASPALAEATPSPAATATSSAPPNPEGAASTPTSSPAAPEQAKRQTELRISGPGGTVSPGRHTVGVRLLADGKPVKDGYVRLERAGSSGWEYAGRLLTRWDGLGTGTLNFPQDTRLRAVYQGASTRTPATSREIVIDVATTTFRQRAVRVASQQAGKPYRYGSTGPGSFDCSGLMVYVFKQVGKQLPRTSQAQLDATQRISKSAMRPGDLVFTQRNGRVGHVGVYAGNNKFWVAPKSGDVVKLQTIYTSNYLVGRVR
ncbi:MAG: NlpC/P60 family protein [Mycobacteriales bacterium]